MNHVIHLSVKKIIPQILEYVKPAGYSSLTLRAVLEILYAVKLPPLTQREKRYKTLLGLGSIPTKTKESSEVCEDSNSFLFLYDYLFPFL